MTMTLIDWTARISAIADALSVLDGGFSVNPVDGSDVRWGYAVAVHPEHERVYERRVTSGDIHEYIAQVKDVLSLSGRVLGGWCDPATGRVYLDVSVVTADLSEALALAVEAGQLAIFDFSAMASVPVLASSAA